MDKIKLKRLMTDVAEGKKTKKDVELLIKPKKTSQNSSKDELKASEKSKQTKNTRKRKLNKQKEVK